MNNRVFYVLKSPELFLLRIALVTFIKMLSFFFFFFKFADCAIAQSLFFYYFLDSNLYQPTRQFDDDDYDTDETGYLLTQGSASSAKSPQSRFATRKY